jgi:hypothetical protein
MTDPQQDQVEQQNQADIGRILEKVQRNPMGELLIRNAAQECLIEDQQELIASMRKQLLAKNGQGEAETTPEG